jgi:hypothetical protein
LNRRQTFCAKASYHAVAASAIREFRYIYARIAPKVLLPGMGVKSGENDTLRQK